MKKIIFAIIAGVFALTDAGAVTRIECRIDTARGVIVIPAVEGGADVAVAVIDKRIGTPDTLTTIASQLLLQSDLRGYVEDAAWYLRAPAREAAPAADALMLTQGWTRYDIPAAIRGDVADSLAFPIEIGAQLDGVIRSKWRGKPLAGVTANVLAPRMADGASATTDSLGRFSITGLEWPDSTWLVVSAMNSKGKLEENIHPDFDTFPAITSLPENDSFISIIPTPASEDDGWEDYVARLNSSPQGMQITLKEVVVRGMRNRDATNAIDFLASVYIRPGQDETIRTYEDAVTHIPGVNVINDRLMHHQTPVSVWVDGRYLGCADGAERIRRSIGLSRMDDESDKYDTGLLTNQLRLIDLETMYPFLENESVAYFPPYLSMFFSMGARQAGKTYIHSGGVLNIKTKNPGKFRNNLSPEFKIVSPLGYQKPKEFYLPKIDISTENEIQRNGATLFWMPYINLSNSFQIKIPASEGSEACNWVIVIEGLSNGNVIGIN